MTPHKKNATIKSDGKQGLDYERGKKLTYSDNSRYREYMESEKWRMIAEQRLKIDGYKCQGCGSRGSSTNPLEVHHLTYGHLYREEQDGKIYTDLVTVCHCCHKNLHRIMERITDEYGRRGWLNNPRIPDIHVFNIKGALESKEGKK